jgi:DNA replication protein DnaC
MTTEEPRTGGGWHSVGEHANRWAERIADAQAKNQERRARIIAERGWPDDVSCVECGDTGLMTRQQRGYGEELRSITTLCGCDAGDEIHAAEERTRRWNSMMPVRLRDYRLETSPQQEPAEDLREWIHSRPWESGENALIYGPIGTGKTGLAVGAMHVAFALGIPTDWLIQQRPSGDAIDDPMERATRPALLVIDDLGTQKNSEWVHERLYVLINRRYLANKATILTTNHSDLTMLRESLGDRAASRLMEQCRLIGVGGEDLRARNRREQAAQWPAILEGQQP